MSAEENGGTTPVALMAQTLQALARTEQLLQSVQATVTNTAPGTSLALHDGAAQLRELRAAMPRRVLRLQEGLQIAERQAELLRWQLGRADDCRLPTKTLRDLPFLTITTRANLSQSALVTRTGKGWVVVLNEDEPRVRQRFSLCHELKHVLDDPFTDQQTNLYRGYGGLSRARAAERVCDHFAGSFLMPKRLVRRDWVNRLQDPSRLAQRYQVSKAAMEVRLRQLGLTEPVPRCNRPDSQSTA